MGGFSVTEITQLDVTGDGDSQLELVLKLAFLAVPGGAARAYAVVDHPQDGPMLQFFWTDTAELPNRGPDNHPSRLLFPHTAKDLLPLVTGWLYHAKYDNEPNFDGSLKKGWRVHKDQELPYGYIMTVTPAWNLYGK